MTSTLVVTTISAPNEVLYALANGAKVANADFIIVGDRKTPENFKMDGVRYLSPAEQDKLFPNLSQQIPWNHYARKNIGYLAALGSKGRWLVETDDDNYPMESFFQEPNKLSGVRPVTTEGSWLNVYDCFSSGEDIWPRGYPLELLAERQHQPIRYGSELVMEPCLVQGLADDNPDVDAVFRMTRQLPFVFDKTVKPVRLSSGNWCPFNSQNTWIRRDVAVLAYLPSFCSFRMTDIWRSFVAQRCLWEQGEGVVFVAPTVRQERNEHNLLKDFEDEVSGYVKNAFIASLLDETKLTGDYATDITRCYEALVKADIIPALELPLLNAWLREIDALV